MNRLPIEYVGIIWGVFGLLATLSIIFAGGNILLIGILAVAAVLGTLVLSDDSDKANGEKEKRSASSDDTRALLQLLDEDDLRELRGRVKQRLLDKIEQGGDGELSSLDALLAEQQLQKRR